MNKVLKISIFFFFIFAISCKNEKEELVHVNQNEYKVNESGERKIDSLFNILESSSNFSFWDEEKEKEKIQRAIIDLGFSAYPYVKRNFNKYYSIKNYDLQVRCVEMLGGIGKEKSVSDLLSALIRGENTSGDIIRESAIEKEIVKIGKLALQETMSILKNGDDKQRYHAVQILGKIGNSSCTNDLISAYNSESDYIYFKSEIIQSLKLLHDTSAIPFLIKTLPESVGAAEDIAETLGEWKVEEAIPVLIDEMNKRGERNSMEDALSNFNILTLEPHFFEYFTNNSEFSANFIHGIRRLNINIKRFSSKLQLLTESNNPYIASASIDALANGKDTSAIPCFIKALYYRESYGYKIFKKNKLYDADSGRKIVQGDHGITIVEESAYEALRNFYLNKVLVL